MACRILVPQPGTKPTLPAVEAQSLNHWTSREVSLADFKTHCRKTYCIAQGTLFSVIWPPGREGSLGENGYMYMHGFVPLLLT